MWSQVHKILHSHTHTGANGASPPVIPLRKSHTAFEGLDVGKTIRFSKQCPLKPLTDATAIVIAVRQYRFGADSMKSYQLKIGAEKHFYLTIAEDDQGQYLSVSRALNELEQDIWFGRDALGFFTEQSSAKSIRCKADFSVDGEWAGQRYSKSVDWVEGTVAPAESPRLARAFHYNLLVNADGDKALEIEHDDTSGENRIFITVYRPIEDIVGIDLVHEEVLSAKPVAPTPDEVPLFKEHPVLSAQPKQRQDFRRLEEEKEIHIARTSIELVTSMEPQVNLPSFLVKHEEDYLSLDQVIPPEPERVRVNIAAAHALIERALAGKVRVRDVLREMLGLESALSEEAIFELPLSEEDYRTLAMRYKLRPDHRIEIRSRLEEELRDKLMGVAKR